MCCRLLAFFAVADAGNKARAFRNVPTERVLEQNQSMTECGCCFCLSFTKDSYRDFKKRPSQRTRASKVSPSKESSGESSSESSKNSYVCTNGSRRAGGVAVCTCLVPTLSGLGETSGPRIDRIQPARPAWRDRQYRELAMLIFSPPRKCPIDIFGPLAN